MQRYLVVLFFFLFLLAACNTSLPTTSLDEDLNNPEAFESLAAGGWSGRRIINNNVFGEVTNLTVDAGGGVVVTGNLFPSDTQIRPFLVRYAGNGARLWTRYPGITGSIALDNTGNIYMAHVIAKSNPLLANCQSQNSQVAISKFGVGGGKLWTTALCAKDNPAAFGGGSTGGIIKLAVSPAGQVYVTAGFTGEFCGTLNQTEIPAQFGGSADAFIVAFNPQGSQAWCKTFNSPKRDEFSDLDLDMAGNIYVAASSEVDFNKIQGFLLKYSSSGQELWRRTAQEVPQLGQGVTQIEVTSTNLVYLQIANNPADGGRPSITSFNSNGSLLESGSDYQECLGGTGFFVGPKDLLYVAGSIFNSEGAYSYNYVSQCSARGVVNTIRRWFDSDVLVYATDGNKTDSIFIAGIVSQGADANGNLISPRPFVQKLTATLGD